MAHELDFRADGVARMAYVTAGGTPWHGLGVPVAEAMTAHEALVTAGLDWEAEKAPIYLDLAGTTAPDKVQVRRSEDRAYLGTVGTDYEILQNREAFEWMDSMLGAGTRYETAGVLAGGRRTWILARMPSTIEPVKGDPTELFALIVNSHDGSMALGAHVTPVRVVCQNTVNAALMRAVRSFKVRHRVGMRVAMEEGARTLQLVQAYSTELQQLLAGLAARAVNWELTSTFIDRMIPLPKDEGRGQTLAERGRETLLDLIEGGKGANIPGVRGTAYGLYNAAVEYADFHVASRGTELRRLENRATSSLLAGPRVQFKDRALEVAQAL